MQDRNTEPAGSLLRGQRVAVTQQIPQRRYVWTTRVEGTVIGYEQQQTGAWFAHARGGKLWLDRLTLQKDDGEQVACILDQYSHVEILQGVPVTQAADATTEAAADTPEN